MPEKLKNHDGEEQAWGWSTPYTRQIIASFDQLAVLLGPDERGWRPGQPQKIAGEIRPRTKTLQHTLRSVMVFHGNESQMTDIKKLMALLKLELEPFLRNSTVTVQLSMEGRIGSAKKIDFGMSQGVGAALRRRREGMNGIARKWLVEEIKKLEETVGQILIRIENIMRPPKIIKLGGSSPVTAEDMHTLSWGERLDLVLKEVARSIQELWQHLIQNLRNLFGGIWKSG